jgi:hypothetical protein
MAYKVADRAKEWTTYAGLAVAAIGAAVPSVIPVDHWAQYWGDAQLILGAVLVLLPQTAGTTAVENEAMSLLQALSAKVPPQYSQAMQPFVTLLAKGMLVNAPVPQPQPIPQPIQQQPIMQQPLPMLPQQSQPIPVAPIAPAPAPAPARAPVPAPVVAQPIPVEPATTTLAP